MMRRATCNKHECAYVVHRACNWQEVADNWKSKKIQINMMSRVVDNKHMYALYGIQG